MKKVILCIMIFGLVGLLFGCGEEEEESAEMTCNYTSNQGSETHVWTFNSVDGVDALYTGGKKMTGLGFTVERQGKGKIFITRGTMALGIPIQFFVDFENRTSVETAAGMTIPGVCF